MVRLKDIALHARVSVMTASKAMRDAPDISAATKARIKLLAQQMGYVPDGSARNLRTRTTRLLGVVIPSTANPLFNRVLLALEERAHDAGYDLLLAHSLNAEEREAACIQRLLTRRVDGLFINPVYRMRDNSLIYQTLQTRGVPVVLLGHNAPFCSQFVSVVTDDLLAGYAAAQHLLQLGHKRIAFFGGPPASPWSQERFEGYRRALREANLEVDDDLVFQAGSAIEDGEKAALQYINESPGATAVLAVTDMVAIGCANTLLSQGIKVPQHVSIMGFGNILTSEHFRVPLTTMRQPKYRLGCAAMDAMSKLLAGQRGESRRLRAEVVIRESTAPPPAPAA